ncbi:hypothetical protein [Nocardioides speluncae]|uniref:hypothetical protein n=1 Tax=Nocardioides speluncae TaxID=2670337 RepID=UPI000D697866|nr:hypothetical protein [Nocardioides speluncae]
MSVKLLPGIGAMLPGGLTLEFGAGPEKALEVLRASAAHLTAQRTCFGGEMDGRRSLPDAHESWLSGLVFYPEWDFVAEVGSIAVRLLGGGPGETGRLSCIEAHGFESGGEIALDGVQLAGIAVDDLGLTIPDLSRQPPGAVVSEQLALRLRLQRERVTTVLLYDGRPETWAACCAGRARCLA